MEQGAGGPQILVGRLWAGPLDEQMGAKLVADLQTLLHSPNVALYPGPRYSRPLYQVEKEIIRFSGDDSTFTLRAVSTISSPNERRILSRETFSQSVRLDGQGARAYVAAALQALKSIGTAKDHKCGFTSFSSLEALSDIAPRTSPNSSP